MSYIIKGVERLRIDYEGIFHLKNLYKLIREWLKDELYFDPYDSDEYMERFYSEKRNPVDGDEIWFWWRTFNYPGGKNSYYRTLINIDCHVLRRKKTEIMAEGKKFGTDSAEVEVFITGLVEVDWQNKWEKSPLLRDFNKYFRRWIFRKEIEGMRKKALDDSYRLHGTIKQYLELKGFMPEVMPFRPPKGVW